MAREYGFSGFPVVEQGELVGIVTGRDLRVKPNAGDTVAAIMTPKDKLVTAREGTLLEEMKAKLYENRIEKMLVVDENFYLRGLVTFRDIEKAKTYPLASKDEQGRLRVGAAVGTGADTGERVAALVAAGVDVVVVDTAHGHSKGVIERVRWVKQTFPDVQVIGGNIATAEAAKALAELEPTRSRSASARARSAPPASSPVSACRRSPPSPTLPPPSKAPAYR